MICRRTIVPVLMLLAAPAAATSATEFTPRSDGAPQVLLVQRARSCKQVSSCAEAVQIWCDGYRRADGDGDGIPCENVCSSLEEVERLRAEIGC
ncbi:MAG: excalibur calcium-binding domain-containing protein [Rhizobiaceae bacterium]